MQTKIRISYALKVFVFLVVFLSGLILPANSSFALSYGYSTYPKGEIGIARPDIGVNIDMSQAQRIKSASFYFNNELIERETDTYKTEFVYHPEEDLAPGDYHAELDFQIEGYQPVSIDWDFTVLEGASSLVTTTTSEQEEGLRAINDYRALLGLPQVKFNAALNTAAQKHAHYLASNEIDPVNTSISLHDEDASQPNYIGASLSDRLHYVGYTGGGGEDVAYDDSTLVEAIDSLFDAPYHRTPFLIPGMTEVGIYKEGNYHVIEFGYGDSDSQKFVVSPAEGDVYVPTSFDGHESPDPLRMHQGVQYPVGYPIMGSVYSADIESLRVTEATLEDSSGTKVELLVNDSSNDDHLSSEVMLIPSKPLDPDTIYSVHLKVDAGYKDGSVKSFEKDWKFRTEPSSGIGVRKLHEDVASYKLQMGNFGIDRKHEVVFGLDNDYYSVDDVKYPMLRKPYIVDGTSYLYIRDLAAALGAQVTWDDSRKAAIYTKQDKVITFYTNRNAYSINGTEYATDSPAKLVDETTMIPVRLLSEALGATVKYIESTRTVVISY